MLHSSSRRSILGGLAALPAVATFARAGTVPVSSEPAPVDAIEAMWVRLLQARGAFRHASNELEAARERLPWWAKPGPCLVDKEGNFSGSVLGWPAIIDHKRPSGPGFFRIRLTPADVEKDFRHDQMCFGEAKARVSFDEKTRVLQARVAAQKDEERRVGLPELDRRYDAAAEVCFDCEEAILGIRSRSPSVMAAQLIVTAVMESYTDATPDGSPALGLAVIALRAVLPDLTGNLAIDAAEFVDNPDRPIAAMRASRGILPIEGSDNV